MKNIDWSSVKIRASCISKIMTEPKLVEEKKAGNLSQTAKSYLKELYIEKIWGLDRDIYNKYCDKGKLVEEQSITLISRLDKKLYTKNEEHIQDEFFTGTPDMFEGPTITFAQFVVDAKSSWDAFSFIGKINEPLDKAYEQQLQIYLHLTNAPEGAVDYVLVSTPEEIIMQEERKLGYSMNVIDPDSNKEFQDACEYLRLSSTYDHIPIEFRRLRFPVTYDPSFIEKAQEKVAKAREYLQLLHEKHLSLNKK
jgi:hypothetical protein